MEYSILSANKTLGPSMSATKQWLEGVMMSWATNPVAVPLESFGSPTATFEEASAEAVNTLTNNGEAGN
jgi:hypothetical protein